MVFCTVHVPLVHPVWAVKQLATADHIGRGRLGLNIVVGWNQREFSMFGRELMPHDDRYEFAAEWFGIVERIWAAEGPFDHETRRFSLQGVMGAPAPVGGTRSLIMNAGISAAGLDFAVQHADVSLVTMQSLEEATVRIGRMRAMPGSERVQVFGTALVVCRPTRAEALAYLERYSGEYGDYEAVDDALARFSDYDGVVDPEMYADFRKTFAASHGMLQIVRSPDDVARQLATLHHEGMAGVALTFVNHLEEVPFFREQVIPRLVELGVR
ncbi:MAG: LLM class flavin-dependent oxidoreductase [Deltaproteobacteria bacterium]|nr:LLM class flavin-dependent oxidoreductase [Deltaproteobacteria bacterium]